MVNFLGTDGNLIILGNLMFEICMLRFHWLNIFFCQSVMMITNHEGWRECLNQLAVRSNYLKNSEVKDLNKIIFICWISGMVPFFL